jgi:23S rRNA (adenine2503-C2)-methyltransferase
MPDKKTNLYDLDHDALEALFKGWGQPRYRADQVWTWLYNHLATDIKAMTSLSKALRARLLEEMTLYVPSVLATQESLTGETRKDLLQMQDGERVEVVLMRYTDRRTACISTQVGCAVGCQFCATGQMGLRRNLSTGEIISQVLHFERELQAQGQRLTNVVFMGMGEPFLNYDNTMGAVYRLIDPDGIQMGQRRITMSTVGIVPGIERFTQADLQVNLAISLHAATDELRSQLLPINSRYNLDALFSAIHTYIERTNRQVTFEWAMIDGVNDTPEQAAALAARVTGMLAHVNLIPLNPTADYAGRPSTSSAIEAFADVLDRRHIPYTVRLRRGGDIQAGCGQLRARVPEGS